MRGGSGAHRRSVRPARNAGGCGGTSGSSSISAQTSHLHSPVHPHTVWKRHTDTLRHTRRGTEPLQPRHVVCCHRDGGVGAQLPADTAEAGRAGVRLPCALPGCGRRDEPGVGDCRRPVLSVSVGVLLEAGEHRELAVQQHAGFR